MLSSLLKINSFKIFYFLVFIHVLGSTWLDYSSLFRFFGFLIVFPIAIYKFKLPKKNLIILSILIFIFSLNLFFSINYSNSLYAFSLIILVLLNEYVFSRDLKISQKLLVIKNCLRIFMILSILAYLIGDNRVSDNIYGNDELSFGNAFSGVFESVNYFYLFFLIYISLLFLVKSPKINFKYLNIDYFVILIITAIIVFKFQNINRAFILGLLIFFVSYYWTNKYIKFLFFTSIIFSSIYFTVLDLDFLSQYGIKTKDFLEYGIFGNRTSLWNTVFEIIGNLSYVFSGVGISNETLSLSSFNIIGFENLHAHNTYLTLFHEFGFLFGFILLFLILIISMRTVRNNKFLLPLSLIIIIFSFFDSLYMQGFNPSHIIFYSIFIFNRNESK